jgi:hypothetical protein
MEDSGNIYKLKSECPWKSIDARVSTLKRKAYGWTQDEKPRNVRFEGV